jgi:hypothetical protein
MSALLLFPSVAKIHNSEEAGEGKTRHALGEAVVSPAWTAQGSGSWYVLEDASFQTVKG